jgi:hypothetical protein
MPQRHASGLLPFLVSSLLSAAAAGNLAADEVSFARFDRRANAGERLNVVFFGCSLTWGANATDPQKPHVLEIEPALAAPGDELRLESICVAGRRAGVTRLD